MPVGSPAGPVRAPAPVPSRRRADAPVRLSSPAHPGSPGVRAGRRCPGPRARVRAHRHARLLGSDAPAAGSRVGRRRPDRTAPCYDRLIGLDLADLAVDGCLTKAPCGGDTAGRSPVDRGEQGLKRSAVIEGRGVPLHLVSAGADRHDAPLLGPTVAGLAKLGPLPDDITAHLDRASDGGPTRALLDRLGFAGAIARTGVPAPLQAGPRWLVERSQ